MTNPQLRVNPFAILDVTTRDTRESILDAAEAAGLRGDSTSAQDARSILTNPRKRLEAEMSWLPGVAPSKARAYALADRVSIDDLPDLPALPRGNLIADLLLSEACSSADKLRSLITALIDVEEQIELAGVIRAINEDREISRFPPITDHGAVETAYAAVRKRWIRSAVSALDKTPTQTVLNAVHTLFDQSAQNGLADEFADAYQLQVASFLDRQTDQAKALCEKMLSLVSSHLNSADCRGRMRFRGGSSAGQNSRTSSASSPVTKHWCPLHSAARNVL